jgi:hypothetical protein
MILDEVDVTGPEPLTVTTAIAVALPVEFVAVNV